MKPDPIANKTQAVQYLPNPWPRHSSLIYWAS